MVASHVARGAIVHAGRKTVQGVRQEGSATVPELGRDFQGDLDKCPLIGTLCQGPVAASGLLDLLGSEIGAYEAASARHEKTGIIDRTMPGRLRDHEHLLHDAQWSPYLAQKLGLHGRRRRFIDVGSAIANPENPAQSTHEIALAFPDMQVVAIDLPQAFDKFMRNIDRAPQQQLLRNPNLVIVPGDARDPVPAILEQRALAAGAAPVDIMDDDVVIVRAANSVDIYTNRARNDDFLNQLCEAFKAHQMLLLFNRAILRKDQGSDQLRLLGETSRRGFNHRTRVIAPYGPGYDPPYVLFPAA